MNRIPFAPVDLWTDASYRQRRRRATYGVVMLGDGWREELNGRLRNIESPNAAEMMAIIVGLQTLVTPAYVRVYTDNGYVECGMRTYLYAARWDFCNGSLWKQIRALCRTHRIVCFKVQGHSGIPLNERAHTLAAQAWGL